METLSTQGSAAQTAAGSSTEWERLVATLAALQAENLALKQAVDVAAFRLRMLIDHAPEALVLYDIETEKFIDANPAAQNLFGLPREELLKTGPFALSPASWKDRKVEEEARAMITSAQHGGTPVFEWWHFNARGERFPCEIRLVKIPDGARQILRGVILDISDRKLLELSERARRQILERVAQGANLFATLESLVLSIEQSLPGMTCSVLLLNDKTHCLHLGAAPNLPDFYNAAVDGTPIGPTVGSCGAAAYTSRRMVVSDVAHHPNWVAFRELIARAGFAACWSEPVLSLSGQVLGTFAMYYREPREPSPIEIRAIELAAMLAGLAIEQDRRFGQERKRREHAEGLVRSREHDFAMAARIQAQMLPKRLPQIAGFEFAGRCLPATETGGDFFDYFALPNDQIAVVVADVSSHGFSSALIMIETRRLFRVLAKSHCNLAEILAAANSAIYEDTDDTMFVTAFLGQIDPATRVLSYIGVGHEAYILDPAGAVTRLSSNSLPLGVVENLDALQVETRKLAIGELLVLLSDGFQEAQSVQGELFGFDQIIEIVRARAALPTQEILEAVYQAVEAFCHPSRPGDDMTAMIVKVVA